MAKKTMCKKCKKMIRDDEPVRVVTTYPKGEKSTTKEYHLGCHPRSRKR
jgi:hypothetical protein